MTDKNTTTRHDIDLEEGLIPSSREFPVETPDEVGTARHLWDHRALIAKVTLVGLIVSLITAFLIPKTYKSTVQLMPPDSQSPGLAMLAAMSGGGAGGLGMLAGDLLGLKSSGAMFVGVLRSRSVEDAVIDKFDLRKVYRRKYIQDARKKLKTNTSVSEDRKSGIITIEVEDRDPARAAAIAKTYADELDRVVTTLSTSTARKERIFLEDRLKEVNQDLNAAAKDFSQFASKNSTLDMREQARTMVEAAAMLQGQVIAAESELKGLRTIYTDNNVRVQATEARVAQLRNELKKIGGTPNPQYVPGQDEPEMVNGVPTIRQLPLLGVQYAELYRRVKVQEAVFEVLTKQYELAKVQEVKEVPSVKVLDPPVVPEKKAGPPRIAIILLGSFLAFVLGSVWVIGRQRWDRLDPDDPTRLLLLDMHSHIKGSGLRLLRRSPRR